MSMFEQASRLGLRFDTARGSLNTEDLWNLPLQTTRPNSVSLDQIAVGLYKQLRETTTTSFVDAAAAGDAVLQLKFDITKYIIDVKKAENARANALRAAAERKEHLLEVLSRKQDQALEAKSIEELQAMINGL